MENDNCTLLPSKIYFAIHSPATNAFDFCLLLKLEYTYIRREQCGVFILHAQCSGNDDSVLSCPCKAKLLC